MRPGRPRGTIDRQRGGMTDWRPKITDGRGNGMGRMEAKSGWIHRIPAAYHGEMTGPGLRKPRIAVLLAFSAPMLLCRCDRPAPDGGGHRFSEAMSRPAYSPSPAGGRVEARADGPAFPWLGRFEEGIAPAAGPGGYGYRDTGGRWICEPRFAHACGFSEGRAPVHDGGKWGYVDATGNLAVPAIHDWAGPFREGRAAVSSAGRFRYIDTAGNPVGRLEFTDARAFSGGFAAVRFGDAEEGAWGFIDRNGDLAIPPVFSDVPTGFSEGLAAVVLGGEHGRRMGYIDTSGGFAMETFFDAAGDFRNGLAAVGRGAWARGRFRGSWHYVDRTGARAFPGEFDWAGSFDGGLALAKRKGGGFLLIASGGSPIAESTDSSALARRSSRDGVAYKLPTSASP
jgi:hypothetical protein